MRLQLIAGARPNFVKIAPLIWECKNRGHDVTFVYTGQQRTWEMTETFWKEFNINKPDIDLQVIPDHSILTGPIISAYDKYLTKSKNNTDFVVVVGDVDSTPACAYVAQRHGLKVAHVEAGLRSFDMSMPEEVNRRITDQIADILFADTETAVQNLINERCEGEKYNVGNIMIDTLEVFETRFIKPTKPCDVLVTLHRPSNVDNSERLASILVQLNEIERKGYSICFPAHPRTLMRMPGIDTKTHSMFTDPMSYLEFMGYMVAAKLIITDSGGVQEESTYLHIPCLTLRGNTERPETVTKGTNRLIKSIEGLADYVNCCLTLKSYKIETKEEIPLWDGKTAGRILDILEQSYLEKHGITCDNY